MQTTEKIENGTIRIENGRLVGLGLNGLQSIDLNALDELMKELEPKDISESFNDTIQRIGSLAIHLYKAQDSIPDPSGAIFCGVPDENNLYYIHLVAKFFSK